MPFLPSNQQRQSTEGKSIVYTVGVNHFTADPNAQRAGEHLRHTKNNTLFDISWFRSPICNPNPHTIFDEIKLLARDLLGSETQNSHYKVFVSKNRHKNDGNTRPHVYIHSTHTLYKTCIIHLPSYISDHESRSGVGYSKITVQSRVFCESTVTNCV